MSSPDRTETIQLLINDDGNRAAVRELLEDRYEVETERSVEDADLTLVDDDSFHDYRDPLRERVAESDPVFCPVVLVRRDDEHHAVPLPNPEERESPLLVDDIVEAPIDRTLLYRRLNTLLIRRNQSQELMHYVSKLEESNRSLEQFAYAASHDLQEPLRMVSSYLQLIEQRYEDDLGGALADLRMKIDEHDADVRAESLPRVRGDDDQLRQVFQNLLSNAIKYSGERPPRVRVTARRRGPEWEISVSDNGVGIDPDGQDRIFELFHRLHSHSEHDGSGIGLALCKRIVERHNGRIWVEANADSGSTFSFTLPAVDSGRE